jgi:hypothetical protein
VQVRVSKLGCSYWVCFGVQVCAFKLRVFRSGRFCESWFPFFAGVSLPTTKGIGGAWEGHLRGGGEEVRDVGSVRSISVRFLDLTSQFLG